MFKPNKLQKEMFCVPRKLDIPEKAPCLGGCGALIEINTHGRRQKYVKQGGIYCSDCVKRRLSERMKKNNPMSNPASKEKMINSLKKAGTKPHVLGGNGRGYSRGQKKLWKALGRGWWAEFIVPTGQRGDGTGLPTHYKIDLANSYYGIAIEIDGGSHTGIQAKQEDERKTKFLRSKGWKVLRYRNKEVLNNFNLVMEEILFTISKSKETIITLPMEY